MGAVGRDLRSSISLGEAMGTNTAISCRNALAKFLLDSELLRKMSRWLLKQTLHLSFDPGHSHVSLSPSNPILAKEASENAECGLQKG